MTVEDKIGVRHQLYWNTLLRIPVQIIVLVVSILVTRILDPKDFGIMAIVMMLVGYSSLLTSFGLNEAIIQQAIRKKKILDSIFTFGLGMAVLLTILFFFLSGFIADFFDAPESESVIKVMSVSFIISTFYGIPQTILRRDMRFKVVSVIDAGRSLSISFLTLALALMNYEYWALVYGQLVPLLIITFILCIKVRWLPSIYFNIDLMKSVFHFGFWNYLKTQLNFVGTHVDRFIVGRWIGIESLGYYDKAITLSRTPYDSFTMSINSVMFSSFSMRKDDTDYLRAQFKKSLALVAYINFPIYLGLIAIAPYFVNALLGEKWSPMIEPFQIVLAGYLASSFGGVVSSLVVAVGKYKELTKRYLISIVVFVICCFLLIPYGVNGIALSFLVFSLLQVALSLGLAVEMLEASWSEVLKSISSSLIDSLIMFAIVMALSFKLLEEYTIENMVYIILAGAIAYVFCILLDRSGLAMGIKKDLKNDASKILERFV